MMRERNLFYIQEVKISYSNTMPTRDRAKITSSTCAADIIREAINDSIDYNEFFYIILLNNANDILGISKISEGTPTGTMVDGKMIFQRALLAHASALIFVHNHPSGNTTPSEADKRLTRKMQDAAKLLDINILDHIIITKESFFSFADSGII